MPIDPQQPGITPDVAADNEKARKADLLDARDARNEMRDDMERAGESPLEGAQRRLLAARDAQREEINAQEQLKQDIKELKAKTQKHDKFVFEITDLQNAVGDLQVENEHLRFQVESAQRSATSASGEQMVGSGLIDVQGNRVGWRYDKESFGWFKLTGDRLWMYKGRVRDLDTYYPVDSVAMTLTDTSAYVYVSQNKLTNATSIAAADKEPKHNSDSFVWPIAKFVRKDPSGSGAYTWEPVQVYHTGDVSIPRMRGDNDSPDTVGRYRSIDRRETNDAHFWDQELHNWHVATSVQPGTDALFVYQASAADDKELRYADPSNMAAVLRSYIRDYLDTVYIPSGSPITDSKGGTEIDYWLNDTESGPHVRHTALDFSGSETPAGTGRSLGNTDHDDVYWRAYDDGVSDIFEDAKTFKTSGLLEVLNTDDAVTGGAGGSFITAGGVNIAKKLLVDDDTDAGAAASAGSIATLGGAKIAKKLRVEDDTAASATGGAIYTPGGVKADDGGYFTKGPSALQAGFFTDGSLNVYLAGGPTYSGALEVLGEADFFSSGHTGEAYIGGASFPIDVLQGNAAASINVSGNYAVGAVPGTTATSSKCRIPLADGSILEGYFRGGIFTST